MRNTQIKTVDGGLVLPIPDDIVQALGIREGQEIYLDVDQRHRRMIAMLRETSPPDPEKIAGVFKGHPIKGL